MKISLQLVKIAKVLLARISFTGIPVSGFDESTLLKDPNSLQNSINLMIKDGLLKNESRSARSVHIVFQLPDWCKKEPIESLQIKTDLKPAFYTYMFRLAVKLFVIKRYAEQKGIDLNEYNTDSKKFEDLEKIVGITNPNDYSNYFDFVKSKYEFSNNTKGIDPDEQQIANLTEQILNISDPKQQLKKIFEIKKTAPLKNKVIQDNPYDIQMNLQKYKLQLGNELYELIKMVIEDIMSQGYNDKQYQDAIKKNKMH